MANISDDKIDLRRIINAVKRCKWVCIATFVVLMAGSIYFALTREPKYDIYSIMLIEDDQSSGAGALLGGASRSSLMNMLSIGGFGKASIENEMVVVKSHSVMERVVKKLGLNRKYYLNEGFLHKKTLYGNSPVLVVTDDGYFDTLTKSLQFKIELKKNGKADVKAVRGFFNTLYEGNDMDLPATVKVDGASFALLPTDYYVEGESLKMNVFLSDVTSTVEELSKKIDIDTYDKKSDALLLAYDDPNMQRGKDILNALVAEYKEHRLKGKSEKAMLGVEFIDWQLKTVYESLVQSEASMEKFKEDNKITNIAVELEVMLEAASKLNEGMLEARAQEMMCDLMLTFLKTEESKYSLLPTMESSNSSMASNSSTSGSSSKSSSGSNTLVSQYNDLVLQRMRLLRSAKPDNVALMEVTANIDAMRGAVVESVEQQKKNIQAGLSVLNGQYDEFASRLSSTPKLEREYIIHKRDLELNNQIYLFLLGKKVDYQLRQESNSVPATVIDLAYNKENKPSRLKSIIWPIIGLVMSFVFMVLFVLYWLRRHQEINKEYDMPASVDHSLVYDDTVMLRSLLLAHQGTSKLVSVVYGTSGMALEELSAAVFELSGQIANAGKRVLLIDLGNVCDGECKLNDISSAQADIRPSSLNGMDYLGYNGNVASDMLLNDKFAALVSSLSGKYDKILLLYRYGEDAVSAAVALAQDNDAPVVYLVKSGYTKRAEIDNIAKSSENRGTMAYYIY